MDENLYDEFGNYIGPELEMEEDEEEEWNYTGRDPGIEDKSPETTGMEVIDTTTQDTSTAVVLHEDKKYYPSAEEVFPGVETLVEDEDTQALTEPIIAPIKVKKFELLETNLPETTYRKEFLIDLLEHPSLIRSVAIVGQLSHGKSTLVDHLLASSHPHLRGKEGMCYTDTRPDEQKRGLSLKTTPISTVLSGSTGKSYLFQVADTPGHVTFVDEVTAALRQVDGVVVVVDAVEGVMGHTAHLLRHISLLGLPVVLFISKVDRLILELKLPPTDGYYKLRHTIEEVNTLLREGGHRGVSAEEGSVAFGAGLQGWSVTLPAFAALYAARYPACSPAQLAPRLWGDWWVHPDRRFRRTPPEGGGTRAAVALFLEPLWKLYAHALGEDPVRLRGTLASLGLTVRGDIGAMDPLPLLRLVLRQFFGGPTGFVDMCVRHLPSPLQGAQRLSSIYNGPPTAPETERLLEGRGALTVHVTKLFPQPNGSFAAWGRVWGGKLEAGGQVQVLGERWSLGTLTSSFSRAADPEDQALLTVGRLWIPGGRYRIEVPRVGVGAWVLIEGVDSPIVKTATLLAVDHPAPHTFRPLRFSTLGKHFAFLRYLLDCKSICIV